MNDKEFYMHILETFENLRDKNLLQLEEYEKVLEHYRETACYFERKIIMRKELDKIYSEKIKEIKEFYE